MKKLFAEGSLEESKVILGWELDFCALTAALTEEKFKEWSSDIERMIASGETTVKELDTVIGRNGHACQVLKQGLHFQNRLRLRVKGQKNRKRAITLSTRELEDLELWLKFYKKARTGVSFNLIVFRQPTKMYLSDSCPYGLGGFSINSGRAWRIKLPNDLVGKVSNNLLEFLAELICIWIDIKEGRMNTHDCCLSLGENTSAVGWMHKSNFCDEHQAPHEKAARHLASLCIENDVGIYAQHFKGIWNVVADSLSRDHHIPADILTCLLRYLVPSQIHRDFHISPVPPEIESWLYKTLRLSTKPALDPKEQTASTIGVGLVGVNFSEVSSWATISSWMESQQHINLHSLSASLKQCGAVNLAGNVQDIWLKARSGRPWTKWQRSLQPIDGSIPLKQTRN